MAFGDFTVVRSTVKNVLGSNGLIGQVAINTPAFEFNADGSYKGLLVEPGATNLLTYSQQFDNAAWTKDALGTGSAPVVTPNDAVAPDGTTTADLVVFDRGAGNTSDDRSILSQTVTVVNATTYNGSIFIKAGSGGDVGKEIALRHVGTDTFLVITLTNSWVRYDTTEISTSTSGVFVLMSIGTITADNSVSVHLWQSQLELGSVATSPIYTTNSTVARTADDISLASASSLIGQTEGTLYVEVIKPTGSASVPIQIDDGTDNNRIQFNYTATSVTGNFILAGVAVSPTVTGVTNDTIAKLALAYKAGEYAVYANGSGETSASAQAVPATSIIRLNRTASSFNDKMWIRSVALFPTRLSNAQLASLTTL